MKFPWGDIISAVFITLLGLFLVLQAFPPLRAWAAGIVVSAPVEPGGPFPAASAKHVKGAFMPLSSIGERDNLPAHLRVQGMEISVNGTVYQLYSGTINDRWRLRPGGTGGGVTVHNNLSGRDAANSHPQSAITDLVTDLSAILNEFRNYTSGKKNLPGWRRPYDGRNAPPPLSMIIEGDNQTIVYDATGRNPQPAELTFISYILEGITVLTQGITWNWYSPAVNTQIAQPAAEFEGMQTHRQSYTVTALETYSSHRNSNWIRGQGIYSSGRWPYGKRQVTVRIPISVIRSGS